MWVGIANKGEIEMSNDGVNIQVGSDLVKPIIEAKIQAAVVAALSEDRNMVGNAVAAFLSMKVDCEGHRQTSDYYNKITMMDYLAKDAIKKAVTDAMKQWLSENNQALIDAAKKHISKQSGTIAKSMVDAFTGAIGDKWKFSVDVTTKE
jgi:hypothetical protein